MAWLDSRIYGHPKVTQLSDKAFRAWIHSIAYSDGFGLYGRLERVHQRKMGATPKVRAEIVAAGLWDEADDETGAIIIHDWDEHNAQRDAAHEGRRFSDRRRKQLHRDVHLRAEIQARDGENCRYCGRTIDWKDRKSSAGATYDHVDPHGDNSLENVVACCHGCNGRKGQRTPEQAGMTLLPPPLGSAPSTPDGVDRSRSQDLARSAPSTPDLPPARAHTPARAHGRAMTDDRVTGEEDLPSSSSSSSVDHQPHDDDESHEREEPPVERITEQDIAAAPEAEITRASVTTGSADPIITAFDELRPTPPQRARWIDAYTDEPDRAQACLEYSARARRPAAMLDELITNGSWPDDDNDRVPPGATGSRSSARKGDHICPHCNIPFLTEAARTDHIELIHADAPRVPPPLDLRTIGQDDVDDPEPEP